MTKRLTPWIPHLLALVPAAIVLWPFTLWLHTLAFSTLPIQALTLLVATAWLCWLRQWRWLALPALSALLMVWALYPRDYLPAQPPKGQPLKVVCANVLSSNPNKTETVAALLAQNADIVGIVEYEDTWDPALAELYRRYPYRKLHSAPGNMGLALLSRVPLEIEGYFVGRGIQYKAVLQQKGKPPLSLWLVHTFPPALPFFHGLRNDHLAALASEVASHKGPRLLLGDLNATTWERSFQNMLTDSGLTNPRPGYLPSWGHSWLGMDIIPIDHLLASMDVGVYNYRVFDLPGSDHSGLSAELYY